MKKYIILNTKNNKEFKPELIGSILEGNVIGEYVEFIIEGTSIKFLATEVKETLEIKTNSNLKNIVKEIYKGTYTIQEGNIDILASVEGGKILISGKGKRGNTSLIKGYIEEYIKQEIEFNTLINSNNLILNNIIAASKNTIEFTNIAINRVNGEYSTFVTISEFDEEYGFNREIGYIEFNSETFEILSRSKKLKSENSIEKSLKLDRFIETFNNCINKKVDAVGQNEAIENDIEVTLENIKNIDVKIDLILNERDAIQKNRIDNNLSLAILKCKDPEALKIIELDKQIELLELQQLELIKLYENMFYKDYAIKCLDAHSNYKDNRYLIKIEEKEIYTNDKETYINNCKYYNKNIEILEYIDLNKTLDNSVNMPKMVTVFSYNCATKETFTAIANQEGYSNFIEYRKDKDNNVIYLLETGLDNNNSSIYWRHNDIIRIHNSFGSKNCITVCKFENNENYYINESCLNKHYTVKNLSKDIKDMLDGLFIKLKNNKKYNYDIDNIKELLCI